MRIFRKGEDLIEIVENDEEEVVPEDFRVVVKFRPNPNTKWRIAHDVTPPLELVAELFFGDDPDKALNELTNWLREEYGGGSWKIDIVDKSSRVIRSKTIHITDEDVKYGISKWVLYVKGSKSGRWYKADVEFDHVPTTNEIIDAIGGGGKVKIVGLDEKGRAAYYRIEDIDAPEPEWLKEREDSLERKLHDSIRRKILETQERIIQELIEGKREEKKEDPIDRLIKEIEDLAKSEKLRNIEELLRSLREGKRGDKKTLSDVLFLDPYKAKVESVQLLIKKFAEQGDLNTAIKLLHEIPDGTGAIINLVQAGANLMNAIAMVLAGKNHQVMRESVREAIDRQREEAKKEGEASGSEEISKTNIKIEEKVDEEGWEIEPKVES